MTHYLIAVDDGAMTSREEELADVAGAAHAVANEAKNAAGSVFSAAV